MYNVFFILSDKRKGVIMYDGRPALFETEEDAWDYVRDAMSKPNRPSMMWVDKAGEIANAH